MSYANTFNDLLDKLNSRGIRFSDVEKADANIDIAKGFARKGDKAKAKEFFKKAVKVYEGSTDKKVQKALDKIADKNNKKRDALNDLVLELS
jgi:hypothetical protein